MAFGGFGSNNTSGFGGSTGAGGFGGSAFGGNNASTGSLFGGNNTVTSSGGTGFGGGLTPAASSSTPLSRGTNKFATGFGTSATSTSGGAGGLFGANANTTGGFGSGNSFGSSGLTFANNNNTSGGGPFSSQSKPAFGSNTNTGGSLFGSNNTGSGFGQAATTSNPFTSSANANTTTGFGVSNTNTGSAFGGFGATNATQSNNNNGTAAVPFQATTEKDTAANSTSSFQSLAFQDPYKNKSFEELRVEDYMQGRRYGNSNGQAGAFGQTSGFGGFGQTNPANTSTGGGLFGSGNNNANTTAGGSTAFGGFGNNTAANNNNNTAGAFGSGSTGGGLFAQNKPAGGGLFANNATSGTAANTFGGTASSTGGLFGSSNTGGFGSTNNTGGLFGNNNNNQPQQQQQNSLFGSSSNTNTTGGLFGNQNQNQNKTGSLFGNANATTTGSGLFGAQSNTQQQSNPFGGSTTGSTTGGLFGNTNDGQQKPAFGGFGQAGNAGNTFGNNNGNTAVGGLFGNTSTNNTSGGGLFGNQAQNKPAGTSLFGNSSTANTGSLFGANNQQQNGGGLFGNNANSNTGASLFGGNNNKPSSSLFGATANTGNTNGLSLFGGNNQQNQNSNAGGSLFGNTNSQNNGSSLFGNTNAQQQPQQQTNQLRASLTVLPYGNEQLFSSLAAPNPPLGPLATPLTGAKPTPKRNQSLLGSVRLNTPVYTPRASTVGRAGGYGFSYSSFGTPGSAYSGSLTPAASSLLRPTNSFGSALTSRLNKSFSTSNLRGDGTPDGGSLLRPSPLTAGNRYGTGSMRKLKIDRSLREDLFATPPTTQRDESSSDSARRVTFDNISEQPPAREHATSTELVPTEHQDQPDEERRERISSVPEMEQVNSSGALSIMHQDRPSSKTAVDTTTANAISQGDYGVYWTSPAIEQLKKMSRSQLEKIGKFVVGRYGYGKIDFGAVDLSSVPLDDIKGNIVQLNTRHATVYQFENEKPPRGQQLNVPSTIALEQSWPKGKKQILEPGTPDYAAQIRRLKRIKGTHFVSYEPQTGIWNFKVDHYTTYGLDDDDDEENTTEQQESSGLSEVPSTPTARHDDTVQSIEMAVGDVDDTFQFKLNQRQTERSLISIPGGFDDEIAPFEVNAANAHGNDVMEEDEFQDDTMSTAPDDAAEEDPFASSGGPVQAPSPGTIARFQSGVEEPYNEMDTESAEEEIEPPGAFVPEPKLPPRSILKPKSVFGMFDSPEKLVAETWEEQLQRTMSPKKRDRQALKDLQQSFFKSPLQQDLSAESHLKQSFFGQNMMGESAFGQSYLAQKSAKKVKLSANTPGVNTALGQSQAFRNSMDIMNSLWANEQTGKKNVTGAKDFEYPYSKRPRHSASAKDNILSGDDIAWHDAMPPSFNPATGMLVYSVPGSAPQLSDEFTPALQSLVGEHKDVRFARVVSAADVTTTTLLAQKSATQIIAGPVANSIPSATAPDLTFGSLAQEVLGSAADPTSMTALERHELAIWQLCSVLFDPLAHSCAHFAQGVPDDQYPGLEHEIKKDGFAAFWSELVAGDVQQRLKAAKTPEEKALLHLTNNDVALACEALVGAKDFRLAILISQLPGSTNSQPLMKEQIEAWRKRKDWNEMSEPIRTLYSILAGEVCTVLGQDGATEDRASEFCISERFGLSWRQSFALRVYFGGYPTLEKAIEAYLGDLENEGEMVYPSTPWDQSADDTLVDVLRLFIAKQNNASVDVAELLDPRAVSGRATNSRLAWQLATMLAARDIAALRDDQMDRLTLDYATELEAAGMLDVAAWVLLHLRNGRVRHSAITALLERNGDTIPTPVEPGEERTTFHVLTEDLQIPVSLVWAAKTSVAKAAGNDALQASWLLHAHATAPEAGYDTAAHEVLCASVAPQAVITQDYEGLRGLLAMFKPSAKPEGWDTGAKVYADYLLLLEARPAQRQRKMVQALRRGLVMMEEESGNAGTLEQRVARLEMTRFAEEMAKEMDMGTEEDAMMLDGGQFRAGTEMLAGYRMALGEVA